MIITSSRKPSPKTRVLCRHISKFLGFEYVTRGKTSLSEFWETFLLVGESRGNPANFNFFSKGKCVLSIKASVSLDKEVNCGAEPVIEGESNLAHALSIATGFKLRGDSERAIRVNDKIEFIDKGVPYIILKVIEIRGEGIA